MPLFAIRLLGFFVRAVREQDRAAETGESRERDKANAMVTTLC